MGKDNAVETLERFATEPSKYKHWKLSFEGDVATLSMDVQEDGGLRKDDYVLKQNSYDLGVDVELCDAVQRVRFEHPEVKVLVVTSLKDKIFCAGANIFMLGTSSHPWKVNFCKYTNETRLSLEDASAFSGIKTIAALNGTAAGGGYELALACDEIVLIDDGNSAVSLPEVPLLGVLPGTGGLTRVVDKRLVRRDHADFFSTTAEGMRGKRAVDWRLVDAVAPRSKFDGVVSERAKALAAKSDRPTGAVGITLAPIELEATDAGYAYRFVTVALNTGLRLAEVTLRGPDTDAPASPEALQALGSDAWSLRAFRELDDALLRLRINHLDVGTISLKSSGDAARVLAWDALLAKHPTHWLCREHLLHQKRVLKRLDLTAKTLFAFVEPSSCFAGVMAELVLAADRAYMLDDPDRPATITLGVANSGSLPMSNGLTRLATRLLATPGRVPEVLAHPGPFSAEEALAAGLVTFTPDDIDWEDEIRVALEERASQSPDALTGMEANLRFAGPETMETKIFGRLTAWQNWIFQRPNAVGEKGALTLYGQAGVRPTFDMRRT